MTILYLYQYFGTPKGGWSTRVYEMCRRWVEQGHRVMVVTTPYDKSDIRAKKFIEHQSHGGIDVIVVNLLQSNKHPITKRLAYFLAYSFLASYFAFRLQYDVMIASSGPITIGFPALVGRMLKRRPLVFEVRDLWPRGAVELGIIRSKAVIRLAYWFEKVCYRNSRLIVACSEGMRKDIHDRFPDMNVIVVSNASDVGLFQDAGEPIIPEELVGKKLVVYAGSLGVMDDCSQILDAAAELRTREINNIAIVIIGEGADKQTLIQRVHAEKLENVHILGLMPKTEVAKWLKVAQASLIVFKNVPVLDTSSPNKLFDSLAAGRPIIQTTQGWIKDLVECESVGISVRPNQPEEMADAIITLCTDDDLANRLGRNAAGLAEQRFERSRLAHYMLENILGLIK
ncbi:MAG TPA: glycosyltransferase family 4 protein [Cyclobacteriaceae bacterium]|nr:glycosyltransferase family 4 protein [Cyclobacteriaceae bacterium]